jgi:glycosyltransferase involved in cell wall biosynthesis
MGRGTVADARVEHVSAENAVAETVTSAAWRDADAAMSVVVSTYRRPHYLPGLFAALEAQEAADRLEVIIVDNGSGDVTWDVLREFAQSTRLALCAARIEDNHGPAPGRNAAVGVARAPLVAFTDDDCMPDPHWAAALLAAFADGARLVQGRTETEAGARGPWDHTMTIRRPTQLFETCNVAYRREDVLAAGGFRPLPAYRFNGKPFGGEDTMLGWDILRHTGAELAFNPDAVVEHRIEPRDYRKWLKVRNGTSIFPALVRHVPEVRRSLYLRLFLTPRAAAFDLAVLSLVAAPVLRSWLPLAGVLPYAWRLRPGRGQRIGPWAKRVVPLAVGDAATAFSLWRGSIKHRRVVL